VTDVARHRPVAEAIPDYDYPVPLIVKNTFIDTDTWRPSSLDGFFQERQIHSCVSRIGAPGLELLGDGMPDVGPKTFAPPQVIAEAPEFAMPAFNNYWNNGSVADEPEFFDALEVMPSAEYVTVQFPVVFTVPPPPSHPPVLYETLEAPAIPPPPQAPVLCLAEALPEPELGSPELPTVGSAGHHHGNCKPCAFFHTKGCMQGPTCEFCHLCGVGERKRRRKEKLALVREARAESDVLVENQRSSRRPSTI